MRERLPNERLEWQRIKVWSTPKMEYVGPVGSRMSDAEVLAEMGAYTDTATLSDLHLAWIIEVPGPGRYRIIRESDDE